MPDVREYLEQQPDVNLFVEHISGFLDTWLPKLQADSTRSYATVAFGCTGGRHRSVYLAERLAEHARKPRLERSGRASPRAGLTSGGS